MGPINNINYPSFIEEEKLMSRGYRLIAGVDEAGRGPLAGPVVAAAVILPLPLNNHDLAGIKDSKMLSARQRDYLYRKIEAIALAVGTGIIDSGDIDRHGILPATRLAMKTAVKRLTTSPDSLLIDYVKLPEVSCPQTSLKFGDRLCFSIACASIIAKVTRDRIMQELDRQYPGYGLGQHKGYGTAAHLACLRRLGPCPVHRRSFKPVREMSVEA
jgi:ribonuclease HII